MRRSSASAVTDDRTPGQEVAQPFGGSCGAMFLHERERPVGQHDDEDRDAQLWQPGDEREGAGDPEHEREEVHELLQHLAPEGRRGSQRQDVRPVPRETLGGRRGGETRDVQIEHGARVSVRRSGTRGCHHHATMREVPLAPDPPPPRTVRASVAPRPVPSRSCELGGTPRRPHGLAHQLDRRGGGVAELLHQVLGYLLDGGVRCRWLVIEGDQDFFWVTKRIHNRLHGSMGDGGPLDETARDAYLGVLRRELDPILELVRPGDVAVLHDPQTAGLIRTARRRRAARRVGLPRGCRRADGRRAIRVGLPPPGRGGRPRLRLLAPGVRLGTVSIDGRSP